VTAKNVRCGQGGGATQGNRRSRTGGSRADRPGDAERGARRRGHKIDSRYIGAVHGHRLAAGTEAVAGVARCDRIIPVQQSAKTVITGTARGGGRAGVIAPDKLNVCAVAEKFTPLIFALLIVAL